MLDAVSTIGTAPTLRAASVMNGSVRTRRPRRPVGEVAGIP
jgi:hypothetical protein